MDDHENRTSLPRVPENSFPTEISRALRDLHPIRREDRTSAIRRLKSFDRPWLIGWLKILLSSEDSKNRALGIEALFLVDLQGALPLILPMLDDPDVDVRWTVCYWLTEGGDESAIDPLIRALLEDVSADVRAQAAVALGASHNGRARPALLWAKSHDFAREFHDHTVSECAALALDSLNRH